MSNIFGNGIDYGKLVENFNGPKIDPEYIRSLVPTNPNLASEFHKRLMEIIAEFEQALDEAQEVGMRLVTFGQTITFHVRDIGYYNPSLIRFYGLNEETGSPIELVQHVSQISFLLMAVRPVGGQEPKRIGFRLEQDAED